jgi:pyridoxal phosphate enzyme (YggS family)
MSEIAERLAAVKARIEPACRRAGRAPSEVVLVAVSKKQTVAAVEEAYASGQRDFGENYAQELRDKAKALAHLDGIRWHAIGSLQTNKAKYLAPVAAMFHALDDVGVGRELGRRAAAAGRVIPCLIEVNVGEATKGGVDVGKIGDTLEATKRIAGIEVRGLMVMPPPSEDPEASRPMFRRLREAAREHSLPELSMGMTQDFEVAIEEGATLIRVGTAIFGAR